MNFEAPTRQQIEAAYDYAKSEYQKLGVDTDGAMEKLAKIPISMHCWQGDDVAGFEQKDGATDGGGIMATGNYPGAARNGDELRQDAEAAMACIPGKLRFNLHAIYAETNGEKVERNQLRPEHFKAWMDWSRQNDVCLDFNPTYFAHPKANDGATLSSADDSIRQFWIEHGIACRRIAEAMGRNQGEACVINHWIPDGAKDHPADRWSPRQRLVNALDEILAVEVDSAHCVDAVESKLFGIGSEDFVVGSHEFYMGYGLTRDVMVCLDMGHFHPTETIHDKLSALLTFGDRALLHVSRPIRWDSDHVVIFNDDVKNVFLELKRGNALGRVDVALDFFDASMNRIGAWTIGTRAARKAMLFALLDPTERIQELEAEGNQAAKLGLIEEMKTMPFAAVWDMFCLYQNVPVGTAWISEMQKYDEKIRVART
jgi:L-rhamnose isomerase